MKTLCAVVVLMLGGAVSPLLGQDWFCYDCVLECPTDSHSTTSTRTALIGYESPHAGMCLGGAHCDTYHPACQYSGFALAEEEAVLASILAGTPSEIASAIQEYEPVVYDSELHTILILGCNDAVKAWIPLPNDIREPLNLALKNQDDIKDVLARLGNSIEQFERSAPLR